MAWSKLESPRRGFQRRAMRMAVALSLGIVFTCVSPASAGSAPDGARALPDGFVYVTDIAPDVLLEIRYYSSYNFVGTRIDGYEAPVAIATRAAAEGIRKASAEAARRGYVLKIFDAYRPGPAEEHFFRWAKDPSDARMRDIFYPGLSKRRLYDEGYVAVRSGHSRGSAVDLTLVNAATGKEVDMGSPFDFFNEKSHHGTNLITPAQTANRETLKAIMRAGGFRPYAEEWWHYSLQNEPYPATHFDFPVR